MASGNPRGKAAVDRGIVMRVAQQLLIRAPDEWTGRDARTLVSHALISLRASIAPPQFKSLIAAAHQVGKDVASGGIWHSKVLWPSQPVLDRLRATLPHGMDDEDAARLALNISNKIRCTEFLHPMRVDWFGMITRALVQEDVDDHAFDLHRKLLIAECIEQLLDDRLNQLVSHAEQLHDVTCSDAVDTMVQLLTRRALAGSDGDRDGRPDRSGPQRLNLAEVQGLASLAASGVSDSLQEWVLSLPPNAQLAVHRRLTGLAANSPLARMWVKPIVAVPLDGLRELRVVADDVHYRILFVTSEAGPRVAAFGLRRDLDELIRRALAALRTR